MESRHQGSCFWGWVVMKGFGPCRAFVRVSLTNGRLGPSDGSGIFRNFAARVLAGRLINLPAEATFGGLGKLGIYGLRCLRGATPTGYN